MATPNILFNLEYSVLGGPNDDFYRCKSNWNAFKYNTRPNAVDNRSEEDIKVAESLLELSNRREGSIVGYGMNRSGTTGIFTKDKDSLNDKDANDLMERMKTSESTIYHGVISFEEEYGHLYCANRQDAKDIVASCIPKLFEKSNLDVDNIEWWGALHLNTDNNHIHLMFWEKEKRSINSAGEKCFSQKNVIPNNCISSFKFAIGNHIAYNSFDVYPIRDKVRREAGAAFRNDKSMMEVFAKECNAIIKDNHFQYQKLTTENKATIDKMVCQIINQNPQIADDVQKYKDGLLKTQALYLKIYKDNNISKVSSKAKNFYADRIKEFDSRLGNEFLKIIKSYVALRNTQEESCDYRRGEGILSRKEASTDHLEKKVKARLSRNLADGASKIVNAFFFDCQKLVTEHIKTTKEYEAELLARGEEIIYNETVNE